MDLRDIFNRLTSGCSGKKKSEVHECISRVFGKDMLMKDNDDDTVLRTKYVSHVSANLGKVVENKFNRQFKKCGSKCKAPPIPSATDDRPGRIGPKTVVLDTVNAVGRLLLFGDDRTSVQGLSTFSSIRATACVFSGKWMYEVQIGSNKIMQVGWCSPHCRFTSDAGVGDTRHSYSYDGARVRSWHLGTSHYGDKWLVGDVIGCCIDLDNGTVEFYRNGQSMGVAFRDVYRATGFAFFPAVSVALQENLCANFGNVPFLFPVLDFNPIQTSPEWELVRAEILIGFLETLLDESIVESRHSSNTELPDGSAPPPPSGMSKKAFLLSLALIIFKELTPFLQNSFVVIAKFLPLLRTLLGLPSSWRNSTAVCQSVIYEECSRNMFRGVRDKMLRKPYPRLCLFLDWFWAFLEESIAISVLQKCIIREAQVYDVVSQDFYFRRQLHSVFFMCGLMQHQHTRLQLLRHVLFGKVSFDTFLHIVCPEERALKVALSAIWWKKATPVECEQPDIVSEEVEENGDAKKQQIYLKDCENISESIKPLENLQVEYILLMLVDNDATLFSPSTRKLFLDKYRRFIMDNCIWDMSIFRVSRATAASWWDCHARMLSAVIRLCADSDEVSGCRQFGVPAPSALIFINGELDFFNVDRLGGVLPYLVKTYKTELVSMLGEDNLYLQSFEPHYNRNGGIDASVGTGTGIIQEPAALNAIGGVTTLPQVMSSLARFLRGASTPNMPASSEYPMLIGSGGVPLKKALTVLLDGLLAMYHGSAKKFAEKVCEKRDNHLDMIDCLYDIETRIETIKQELREIEKSQVTDDSTKQKHWLDEMLSELTRSKQVYETTVESGAVLCAWTRASVWSKRSAIELSQLAAASLHLVSSAADPSFPTVESDEIPLEKSEYLRNVVNSDSIHALQSNSNILQEVPARQPDKKEKEESSEHSGSVDTSSVKGAKMSPVIFTFVPVYFVEGALDLCNTIRLYMPPTLATSNIPGWEDTLTSLASLVCANFADSRVALASVRESLVQTLASLATQPHTMHAIERAPEKQHLLMIEELLKPYTNRSWAQSNWVYVRFWHGSGFGYRHRQWPHLIAMYGDREPTIMNYGTQVDAGLMSQCFGPCPSKVIQARIKAYMGREPKATALFLNSLITQINWSFSEFYNMLQELQGNRGSIDSRIQPRHIKMCATFFDLYHGLARALEMTLHLVPAVLTDKQASDGQCDLLLSRTCQTIVTLVSRLCSSGSVTFKRVMERELPGLDRMHYYTALAPLAGCLIQLLNPQNPPEHLAKVEAVFAAEPLFKADDWNFMLGKATPGKVKVFSFRDYGDAVSAEEMDQLESCVTRLASMQVSSTSSSSTSRSSNCAICYSRKPDTRMLPCGHFACRSCVQQHRLNNNFCFFCKAEIEAIESIDSLATTTDGTSIKKGSTDAVPNVLTDNVQPPPPAN